MRMRLRAESAFQQPPPPDRKTEIETLYHQAARRLNLEEVQLWLSEQPTERVVGQPRTALGCLLATFLAERTGQLWAVTQEQFYHFDLGEAYAWWLPTWAVTLEAVELRWNKALTATEALGLLTFIGTRRSPVLYEIDAWIQERSAA